MGYSESLEITPLKHNKTYKLPPHKTRLMRGHTWFHFKGHTLKQGIRFFKKNLANLSYSFRAAFDQLDGAG